MWWFGKAGKTEVWDEKIEWPIGDSAHHAQDLPRGCR
jgi:hypothetical protein